ncbi:translation elongation factor Ts [Candidatus Falkowbacteria bacterium RIFCSPLOWO2_12_FULL_45_13]|uniref:Elongation factor Ts n=2 Tax=Candidatus Falkowiibacteriota TaxID=1752728 RepID=A0A1F5SC36_9BACT|nr:MAG: translation elongation factor Ts [Candidatus Falkowbacteria bacterium RIFCSPLOWO2_02_FULL_45_21]OGF29878.1 MAG: translation elongation factor Ts [Candidatus Falkowbacteria bacterium RIFCSPLOWO2_12_FULL_45_13]
MENKSRLLKLLREKSGAGMADCKIALDEAGGEIEKAIEILRKKGIAKAAKRSDREAGEGVILVDTNKAGNEGYILEMNSETDFVARNEQFKGFADLVLKIIETKKPKSQKELLRIKLSDYMVSLSGNTPLNREETVGERLAALSGTIGEKLEIKKYDILSSAGTVACYTHAGGRIGVLAALDKAGQSSLAYNVAMQIAAANPKYIKPEDVSPGEIAKEKEIYRAQLLKEGKPENMIDKIIAGKLNKFYEEVCLVKQEYIKDDKKSVEDILGGVKAEKFVRYSL